MARTSVPRTCAEVRAGQARSEAARQDREQGSSAVAPRWPSAQRRNVAASAGDLGYAGMYVPTDGTDEPIAGDFYDVLNLGPA